MKNILFISLFAAIAYSCQPSEGSTEESGVEVEKEITVADLTQLEEHLLYTSSYFIEHPLNEGVSFEDITTLFKISDLQPKYSDSLPFENGVIARSFFFQDDQLVALKYASYSDSTQMESINNSLPKITTSLVAVLGDIQGQSPHSSKWIAHQTTFQLKAFPNEGIDFMVSKNTTATEKTACVGDFFAAKNELMAIISTQINTGGDLGSSSPLLFDGISILFEVNELQMQYECTTSEKLKVVDIKSIVSSMNELFGQEATIKDDMFFWFTSTQEVQLSQLENGYSFLFKN